MHNVDNIKPNVGPAKLHCDVFYYLVKLLRSLYKQTIGVIQRQYYQSS